MKTAALVTAVSIFALLAVACGDEPEPSGPSAEAVAPPADDTVRPDRRPLVEGPVSPEGLRAILGTGDLGVGHNRVGFVLTSKDGFVNDPAVTVSSRYLGEGDSESQVRETVKTEFRPWPYGNRGMYTAELEFDVSGRWGLDIAVGGPRSIRTVRLFFDVLETGSAPAVGARALKSKNKTMADVDSLQQLATGSLQDPDLYQTTIAQAVVSGVPTVVVFASPAFCTNAVCGPQVEVLQQLKDKYRGQANFIHVDFYDNPKEIQGDLDRARISPVVLDWRLPSIEWTFVIDRQGAITARFEAFATLDEVEEAFLAAL